MPEDVISGQFISGKYCEHYYGIKLASCSCFIYDVDQFLLLLVLEARFKISIVPLFFPKPACRCHCKSFVNDSLNYSEL